MIRMTTPTGAPEPVAISQAVNGLIVALAATGWFTIDNAVINSVISILGAVIVIINTLRTRQIVTVDR